ncbi:MAG: imidazole glycerol phosphate synthase subunit HisF [Gemmatimonadota bacterium]
MLRPRLIVCLDVRDARVVKGRRFQGLRDVGDPVELARRYEADGADEVVFLDVSASLEERGTFRDTVTRTAETLFVPLTVGGGVRSVADIGGLLRAGADKVSLNSAIVTDPELLSAAADAFGAQCVVASVDAARVPSEGPVRWEVFTHGGTRPTALDAVDWCAACAERGAGEILLTSIDQDGARSGYDIELLQAVTARVRVPVIASGGAANAAHLAEGLTLGGASAVLLAGVLHDGLTTVSTLKGELLDRGMAIR